MTDECGTNLSLEDMIAPYKIFNMINNAYCLRVLDVRAKECFNKARIDKSLHLDITDATAAKYFIQELVRSQTGVFRLVLVLDNKNNTESLLDLKKFVVAEQKKALGATEDSSRECILTKNWKRMENVVVLDFGSFYEKYRSYDTLFDEVGNPSIIFRFKGRNRYYCSEIIPDFLFLGDYQNATDRTELMALGITHIVDATGARLSKEVAGELNIQYLPVNIWDTEEADISLYFEACNNFISCAFTCGGRVLVHCRAGVSRSASLVAAYMISRVTDSVFSPAADNDETHSPLKHPCSLKNVIIDIIKERPLICPNSSFRHQLIEYENKIFGKNSLDTEADFLALIHAESKLYSGDHSAETDFDRVPVQALKITSNDSVWKWENAYPLPKGEEEPSSIQISGDPTGKTGGDEEAAGGVLEGGPTPSAPADDRKEKKTFLKRNTARIVNNTVQSAEVGYCSKARPRFDRKLFLATVKK